MKQIQTGIHFTFQPWHLEITWISALLQSSCGAASQLFAASLINALTENACMKTWYYVKLIWFHILSKPPNLQSTSQLKDLCTCDPLLCCHENQAKTGTDALDTQMRWLQQFKLSLTSGFGPHSLQLSDSQSRHSLTHINWETFLKGPGKWNTEL